MMFELFVDTRLSFTPMFCLYVPFLFFCCYQGEQHHVAAAVEKSTFALRTTQLLLLSMQFLMWTKSLREVVVF